MANNHLSAPSKSPTTPRAASGTVSYSDAQCAKWEKVAEDEARQNQENQNR